MNRKRLRAKSFGACRPESLERRMLLSAGAENREIHSSVLHGPVASAVTAAWYTQRVAALASLHSTLQASPTFQVQKQAGTSPQQSASPDPAGITPAQIESYYGFTGLSFGSTPADGRGQTIAVVEAYDDPNIGKDLDSFDTAYGLSAPPSFSVVSQTGSTTALPAQDEPDPEGSWALEESLDVEWAHTLAPAAGIMVVECNSQNDSDLYAGVAYAAAAPDVSVVSMSFGASEVNYTPSEVATIDPTFVTPPGHQGVTFLASSGDQGAYSDNGPLAVSFPSSSPGVLAVGGTTLLSNSSGKITGETAWTGSGGGISTLEKQTVAQRTAVGYYSGRANPDVSFDADPNTGVNVCDSLDYPATTPFIIVGGTSFSSPAWGAILAITDQGRVLAGKPTLDGQTQTIPALYSAYTNGTYSAVFQDVTTGNNGYFDAGKGYDLVTGLGSPDVQNLVPELATNTVHSTPPVIGSFVTNPAVEDIGTPIALTASDITDTIGNVASVKFYRVNGNTSTLLGSGVQTTSGTWSLSISTSSLTVGTYSYSAIATNNYNVSGAKVTTTNKVVTGQATPTIGSFVVQPWSVPVGTDVTMIATGVADTTGPVASVAFYLDSATTPAYLGQGVDDGDGRWTLNTSTDDFVPGEYRFIAIATAASGIVSEPFKAIDKVKIGPPLTVTVNTTDDSTNPRGSKTVSLRDAVALADLGIGQVTIDFDPKVFSTFQTIELTGITLSLTDTGAPTIINGPAAGVAISGSDNIQVFAINPGVDVSMSNLTITNGASTGSGGGLINAGNTTLTNVIVSDNIDSGLVGNGGGIENDGTLNLIDSTITGNSADNGNGGGLYNTGTLTVKNSYIYENIAFNGGGVGSDGTMTLTGSSVSNNVAFSVGGGIESIGVLKLVSSTVSGNTASNSGGIYTGPGYENTISPVATILNSTIAQNSASYANGGILNAFGGNLIISDSTVAQNSAADSYGGINSDGDTTIANTIVAGNTVSGIGTQGIDVSGVVISKGHNLIVEDDGSSGWISSDYKGTVSSPLNPHLSPLGDFGSSLPTLVPLTGSVAIEHGSVSLIPSGITTDERGFARTIAGKVDIGAVEVQGTSPLKLTGAAAQSAVAGQSASFKLGSFTDSAKSGSGFSVVINWGDGTSDDTVSLSSTGTIPAQPHEFDLQGEVVVTVAVTDSAGDVSNLTTFNVKVAPPPPEVIVVNTSADQTDLPSSSTISLRDAIFDANEYFGPVMIEFDPKVFASHQTITISGMDLFLDNTSGTVSIIGPAAGVTISGGGTTDVLYLSTGASANISNVAIVDGSSAFGGGISNFGNLNIVDSTISGNTFAGNGAGIDNFGTLSLINSTLANNSATVLSGSNYPSGDGGALYNSFGANATITNVTITGNSAAYGAGIVTDGTLTIANTIVAGDKLVDGSTAPEVAGTVTSLGHNLIGEADSFSTGWLKSDFTGTTAKPINAHLSSLSNNGGPTETAIPETGSEALNNGSVSLIPKGITTDQRGKPRTIKGKVDIGAVEI